MFAAIGWELGSGKIGVKLSSGEPGGNHYLKGDLIADLVHAVGGTIVECNTAYGGGRSSIAAHYQVAADHGFTAIADFQIMDEAGSLSLPVAGGLHLSEDLVGAAFSDYDGFLVLSHFKGHMTAASERAMRITSRMNAEFNSLSDTREQLERLFMRPLPQGVGLFPPFTTDCGLNTHLDEDVFINAGCRFQDQGGIYIGDRALIGHNCVIATLNHDMDPAKRANLIPAPVRIGADAWLGSNVTVLPGMTIGEGAVVAAGAVVTRDVAPRTMVGGVPAKLIKEL